MTQTPITRDEKIAKINDVLNRLHTHMKRANHKTVTHEEYEKLMGMRDKLSENRWAQITGGNDWSKYSENMEMTRAAYMELGYADEYMQKHNITDPLDFSFHLSAPDILDMKAPRLVIGCTGFTKLFCHFAKQAGLECAAVLTAELPKRQNIIDGHQIVAVELDGKLVAFDPQISRFEQIPGEIKCGNKIQAITWGNFPKYTITRIMPGDAYQEQVNSYDDLEKLYLGNVAQKFRASTHDLTESIKKKMGALARIKSSEHE